MYKTFTGRIGSHGTSGNPFDHGFNFFIVKPGMHDLSLMPENIEGEGEVVISGSELIFRLLDRKNNNVKMKLVCDRIEHHVIDHKTKTEGYNGYGKDCCVLVTIEYDTTKPTCPNIPGNYATVTAVTKDGVV